MNRIFIILIAVSAIVTLACGGADQGTAENVAQNTSKTVAEQLPTPTPIVEGPIPTPAPQIRLTEDVPGISASNTAQRVKPGTAPTPGIPSEKELRKPFKPGTSPTPGIPSEAEIKRMMTQPPPAANTTMKGSGGSTMMRSNSNAPTMRPNRPPGGTPQP